MPTQASPGQGSPTARGVPRPTGSPAELLDFTGRVVVVTGAGGNIGTGIAQRFLAAGATVVAHTRSSPVDHLTGEPSVSEVSVSEVCVDLTAPDGPQRLIDASLSQHGRLDVLVNNAGIQPVVEFMGISDDDWREMLEANLTAAHRLTQAAAAAMTNGPSDSPTNSWANSPTDSPANSGPHGAPASGSIIHVSSVEGRQPAAGHAHYATAKAALTMHARAAALELGPQGIRVNSVSPGLIDRPGLATDWPEGVDRWLAAAPLGRLGTPADVGDACVFLSSPLARFITGADLVVDGGVLTHPTW